MTIQENNLIRAALASYMEAKAAMEVTFGVTGAPAVVAAVVQGSRPRSGLCTNGFEYFVHGIGYTVIHSNGGQIHIDGSANGDTFSTYDMSFFIETSTNSKTPSLGDVESELDTLATEGAIRRIKQGEYILPEIS
jgi:hypothetical protein